MNRKLHNTVTALSATTGLLVLSLMAARPLPALHATPDAPAFAQETVELREQGRHAAEAAKRIEARAIELQARLATTRDNAEAIGDIVGFAAEAATLATVATAFDQAQAAKIAEPAPKPRKRTQGRQSVAMPYFSFAPRG
jgi:hypothetical protein